MTIYTRITTTSFIIAAASSRCSAFVPSPLKHDIISRQSPNDFTRPSPLTQEQPAFLTRLAYMDMDKDAEASDSISKTLAARTSIQQFLTQRSVQTFMFLLKECHDPHTGRWIENFTEAKNLLSYHGTGAFSCERFPGWDSFLMEMMAQPPDIVVLDIENNLSGLSKNNPFREKETVRRQIEIDIEPPSLAGRILSVRESLSREWTQDLELVISANNKIISSYNEKVANSRITDEDRDSRVTDEDKDGVGKGMSSGDVNLAGTNRHSEKYHAFERVEIYLLNNHPNMNDPESTPLRASNFDLLLLLSTQESIHRALKNFMAAGDEKAASFHWLLEYYSQNVDKYFDGNQQFGQADEFLDNLLRTPPSLINKDGSVDLIDPLAMAEDIIRLRGEVAIEWRNIMSLVPESHIDIRKDIFARQMSKWGQHVDQAKAAEIDVVKETSDFQ